MNSFINKLFRSHSKEVPPPVRDPVLGEVSFSEQLQKWTADVPIDGRIVEFVFAGDDQGPGAAVIAHASDLVGDFTAFQHMIAEFLKNQAAEYPDVDEISLLQIACITLPFGDRPRDGEIGFRGPSDIRVWHARYRDGKPVSLGFED